MRLIELRIGPHSICGTRDSCDPSQGRDRGCGEDNLADQMIVPLSNQTYHAIWGDADTSRTIEFRIGSHSICGITGSCDPSQGRDTAKRLLLLAQLSRGGSRDIREYVLSVRRVPGIFAKREWWGSSCIDGQEM
jgi:hypothetical protein